jgi:hypothetical protein
MSENLERPPAASEGARAFGPMSPIAELALKAERERHAELRERVTRQQAQLAVLREALMLREREGATRLVPLEAAARDAQAAYDKAAQAAEEQRRANQSDCLPLLEEIGKLITELNRPLPGYAESGVKQWQRADWYSGPTREQMQASLGDRGK